MQLSAQARFAGVALPFMSIVTLGVAAPSYAFDLGIASDYNVFVFNDINQSSDAEGRVAVGGNATFTNFGIGDRLANSNGTDTRLVVGGNLTYNGGQIFGGNAVVGGSVNTPVYFNCSNCGVSSGNPINFDAAEQELNQISAHIAGLQTTGITEFKWGGFHLQGNNSNDLNVFTLDGSLFSQASYFNLSNVRNDSTLVFNILGDSVNISNFGFNLNGYDRSKVLFNFVDATQVKTSGVTFSGSVLATKANFQFSNGNIEGNFVANSVSGSGEFHNFHFDGNLPELPPYNPEPPTEPESPVSVPEPTAALSILVIGGLLISQRRPQRLQM